MGGSARESAVISAVGSRLLCRRVPVSCRCSLCRRAANEEAAGVFTGIIEELGTVVGWAGQGPGPDGARLVVRGETVAADARHGDSIAVNGVCLTVVEV